jgi:hypothetical protein
MFTRKLIASTVAVATLAGGGLAVAALNPLAPAGAQEQVAPQAAPATEPGHRGARWHHHRRAVLKLVADTIGIAPKDLVAALKDGQSIAQVAEAHGVATQTVVDAVIGRATERIDKAVAAGKLDADRAAKIKERLPQRVDRLVHRSRPAA